MTAQYRAGRQADALHTYQQLRRRLIDELGLEPGPEVRELEGRILRHELSVAPSPFPSWPERQRRRVTVVAVELAVATVDDHPLDPEDELALAAPVRQAARSRIVERGGVILGDIGFGLSACFGYPSTERSIERAVLAALAVRDLAAGADGRIAIRIGVDTGVVVVEGRSQDGTDELSTIAGEPLRAATRLRSAAADGEVLVGAATAEGVRTLVELAPLDPVDGRSAALVVGAPAVERVGLPARRTGLVDREDALTELVAIAEHATTRLCPVVITGPTGIGKSAVAETFLAGLDDSWSVVELFCDPRRSVTPLHPFRPVLPELFSVAAEPSARAVVAALRELWGTANPVLLVDDVDAADPSTRQLLDEFPEHLASGLLLLTSRSPSTIELNDGVVAHIALGPLDRAGIAPGRRGDRRRAEAPSRRAQPDRRSRRWCSAAHRRAHRRRAGFPGRRGERAELAVRLVDVGPRSPRAGAVSRPAAGGPRAFVRRRGPRSGHCGRRPGGSARPPGGNRRGRRAAGRRRELPVHQHADRRRRL